MSDSQSVPNVEDDSFATIIIIAHGQDLRSRRATLEQQETLRKFTLAGKSGHEVCVPNAVVDNMFYMAHQLARLEHVPFTAKLKYMRTESKRQQFDKIFQNLYHNWEKEKTKTAAAAAAAAAEAAKFKSLVPTVDDWLSTTNVSYDHFYEFAVHDPADPWEIDKFGIWLVDGSPQVLQGFKDVPIPLDSLRYYNIMDRIGFPQWHAAGTVTATTTTLFDVAEMTKRTFHVKYVNIVDMSCRVVYQSEALDVLDDPISDIKPSASHQPDIQIGDIRIRRSKQPPDLPAGWVFGQNLTTSEYVFANPDSGEISPEFPEADSGAISPMATLEGHTGSVNSVAFNSTGFLATGSADRTVKLWNTKGCVATLEGNTDSVLSVAFNQTQSGKLLATGSGDNAKLWNLLLLNKIKHPKMFGMPQTLPQGWIYVKGNVPFQTYYGNEHDTKYDTYYVGPKGEINPHGPYKYTAGSKKSSKQNKKKTKRSSKQNKKKTKKTKVLK